MEYIIVVMLCAANAQTCAWHKLSTPTYSSFEECVEKGKDMDFKSGDYGPVYKAGCAKLEDAAEIPEFHKDL